MATVNGGCGEQFLKKHSSKLMLMVVDELMIGRTSVEEGREGYTWALEHSGTYK